MELGTKNQKRSFPSKIFFKSHHCAQRKQLGKVFGAKKVSSHRIKNFAFIKKKKTTSARQPSLSQPNARSAI
jgi:hypothetical protein